MKNNEKTMEKIVALCKGRGFIFAGSEIYGGLANTWDYGPLGAELKNNVKKAWWKKFVQENKYNVGLDSAILMNPQTWVASGHLGGFSDPLMDCRECKERFRADKLIEDWTAENGVTLEKPIDAFSQQEMKDFIENNNIPCPTCGKHNFTDIRQFNLMFKTFQGVTEDAKNTVYLRPETAQGIFVNFPNVQRASRKKLPSVSDKLVNHLETKSHLVTSFSAYANLNRWNSNSSASREPTSNGLLIGVISATSGCFLSASRTKISVCVTTILRSYASTQRQLLTLNSCSRLVGVSFGALPTEPITTFLNMLSTQERI